MSGRVHSLDLHRDQSRPSLIYTSVLELCNYTEEHQSQGLFHHVCVELPSGNQLSKDPGAEAQGKALKERSCRVRLPEGGQEIRGQDGSVFPPIILIMWMGYGGGQFGVA